MVFPSLSRYPSTGRMPEGVRFANLRRFENFEWEQKYVEGVQKLIHRYDVYSFFQCFPYIPGARYGKNSTMSEMGYLLMGKVYSNGWWVLGHLTWYIIAGTCTTWNHMFLASLFVSLGTISSTLATPTPAWHSWIVKLMVQDHGDTSSSAVISL